MLQAGRFPGLPPITVVLPPPSCRLAAAAAAADVARPTSKQVGCAVAVAAAAVSAGFIRTLSRAAAADDNHKQLTASHKAATMAYRRGAPSVRRQRAAIGRRQSVADDDAGSFRRPQDSISI